MLALDMSARSTSAGDGSGSQRASTPAGAGDQMQADFVSKRTTSVVPDSLSALQPGALR